MLQAGLCPSFRAALSDPARQGTIQYAPYSFALLSEVLSHTGNHDSGSGALRGAAVIRAQSDERWWDAEICRLRGWTATRFISTKRVRSAKYAESGVTGSASTEPRQSCFRARLIPRDQDDSGAHLGECFRGDFANSRRTTRYDNGFFLHSGQNRRFRRAGQRYASAN